jgi:predicted NUDIX family phosphoesterase
VTTFLDAAYRVLRAQNVPMTARQITEHALRLDLIQTTGKTPAQTMKAKLSTEILTRRESSPFMRTEAGHFGLREWQERGVQEHVADRYVKALLKEDAIVFPATSLESYIPGPGLFPMTPERGQDLVAECVPMPRIAAEEDTSVIQLISGFVVQHGHEVLTYKRTRRLPESRLHGEYSVFFGGHLNPNDMSPLFNIFEPANAHLMERELNEELRIKSRYTMTLRGILYDNSRPVSRQHIAIVFDVALSTPDYTVGERGFLQHDKFERWQDVGARLGEFENWSQLLYRIYTA